MRITWHLETRKLKDLKEYNKNPRKLTKDQKLHLTESIRKFGLVDKPAINLDNTLIGGHQRKRILKELGIKEIDVHVPDRELTDREIEELNIRLNKNSGEWDWDILANQFEIPDLMDWGFTEDELNLGKDDEESDKPKKEKLCPHCGEVL